MKKQIRNILLSSTLILGISTITINNYEAEAKTVSKNVVNYTLPTNKSALGSSKTFKSTYKKRTTYKKKYPKTYKYMEKDVLNLNKTSKWDTKEFKKVSKSKIDSEITNLLHEVSYNNPQKVIDRYDSIPTVKGYARWSNGKMEYQYRFKKSTVTKYTTGVNNKVKSIAPKLAKPSDSDYKKVKAVHNYVVNNMSYDYSVLNGNDRYSAHLAYGGLVQKLGVCDAYAKSVEMLLNYMGVESGLVYGYGNGIYHAWNYVKIDGKYYYLDATWNDTAKTNKYFLINTKEMQKDHVWVKSDYPKATSTKYMK